MADFRFDREKFKELVLYISEKCETDPSFGVTKLNKLLYFCDFTAYAELGKPITGASYQRRDFGPAPAALMPIREEMQKEGSLFIREGSKYGYQQKRPLALRSASLKDFSGEEVALVDRLIGQFWELDASQISDLSHKGLGYRLARDGEAIPYETAYLISLESLESA